MPIVRLATTDPFTNLAVESYLLDRVAEPTLLVWRNDPCVVIGRHQNPWVECDLERMHADGVPLVRRISGGGAVYHDHGNTNFSFLAPSDSYDQTRHFAVVISALDSLGVRATLTERNDLRVGDRKISGNAFRHTRGKSLHHGTLLVHADVDRLTAYLAAPPNAIVTKATQSVRSVVTNLREHAPDLTHAALCAALEAAFTAEYGPPHAAADQPPGVEVDRIAAELAEWGWIYGHTPRFVVTVPVPGGGPAGGSSPRVPVLVVTVVRGLVESISSETMTALASHLDDTMRGRRYDERAVRSRIAEAVS